MLTLIIDADDTLWENQLNFNNFTEFFKNLLTEFNIPEYDGLQTLEHFDSISYSNNEFGNVYYKESMKKTLAKFGFDSEEIHNRIDNKHDKIFNHAPLLFDGVKETLEYIKEKNVILYILTKGYYPVQMTKIELSGIDEIFDGFIVTTRKNREVYENLIIKYKLDKQNTYMVGNSPKSDILPALEAGLNAVYIPSKFLWELENCNIPESNSNYFKLDNFSKLKDFVDDKLC